MLPETARHRRKNREAAAQLRKELGVQRCVINDWLPAQLANGSHGHWSQRQKKLEAAQIMAWAACRQAGWQPVAGRVRLTITLVFSVKRRRDTDNIYSRIKGLVDGIVKGGWIEDDSTDVLELEIHSEVQRGRKATILELAPLVAERQAEESMPVTGGD